MGDEQDARAVFDAAYPLIVTTAEHAIGNFFDYAPGLVDDAVAVTMVRTYEEWERVGPPDDQVVGVLRCAKVVCIEQLLRDTLRSSPAEPALDSVVGVIDLEDSSALSAAIWRALRRLPPRHATSPSCTASCVAAKAQPRPCWGPRSAWSVSPHDAPAHGHRSSLRPDTTLAHRRGPGEEGQWSGAISAVLVVLLASAALAAQTSRHDSITVVGKPVSPSTARPVHHKRPTPTRPDVLANRRCVGLIVFVQKKKPKPTTTTAPPITEPPTTTPPPTAPPNTMAPATTQPPMNPPVTVSPTTAPVVGRQTPTTTRQTATTIGTQAPTTVRNRSEPTVVVNGVPTVTTSPRPRPANRSGS